MNRSKLSGVAKVLVTLYSLGVAVPGFAQETIPAEVDSNKAQVEDAEKGAKSEEKKRTKKKKPKKKTTKKKSGRPKAPEPLMGVIKAKGLGDSKAFCFFDKKGKMVQCGKVLRDKADKEKYVISQFEKYAEEKALTPDLSPKAPPASSNARMWFLYNPALFSATSASTLGYKKVEPAQPRDSLWEPSGAYNQALFSFGMQVKVPLGSSFGLLPGFRYRAKDAFLIDSNYDEPTIIPEQDPDGVRQQKVFARIHQEESAVGMWLDFEYWRFDPMKDLEVFLTSGLDIDMSTLKMRAVRLDDAGILVDAALADATSELTVVSARLGAGFDYLIYKSFGIHTGLNILVPFLEMGRKFDGDISDFNANYLSENADDDLGKQLGHKKASFGAEITIGIVQEL